MKKRWVILIVCLSGISGFLSGAYAGVRFWQRFDEAALETRLMADAKTRLSALSSLRNAHEDKAILLLESLLDGDIIGIDSIAETSDRREELIETLSRVAKYRAGSPYRSSNEDVASVVAKALEHASPRNGAAERGAGGR